MDKIKLKEVGLKKSRGFVQEFKTFVLRGNVIDLAVGVIIGAAFQGIVQSLVADVIMPIVSLVTGGIDFSEWFIALDGKHYIDLAAAKAAKAATLNFGVFLTTVINFFIMAFVIFLMVKAINRLTTVTVKKKDEDEEEAEAEPTVKSCPYCLSEINIKAVRCPHCTSALKD